MATETVLRTIPATRKENPVNAIQDTLLNGPTFLTNGGTETYLLFQQGFPLRDACAFEVYDDEAAWTALDKRYLRPILDAAHRHGHGVLLDTLVWRSHADYLSALGYPQTDLVRINRSAVAKTAAAVSDWRTGASDRQHHPILLSADLGPRGDGYKVRDAEVRPEAARDYHRQQIEILAGTGVDVLSATTMTSVRETIGLVQAATQTALPVIVSPTVDVDGQVPDGTPLGDFIAHVDEATAGAPLFYMVNCAHPSHLTPTLHAAQAAGADWLSRFRGFRANASCKSHEELDESPHLDRGDPSELANELARMTSAFDFRVVGGCCGTDVEHITAIAEAIAAPDAGHELRDLLEERTPCSDPVTS